MGRGLRQAGNPVDKRGHSTAPWEQPLPGGRSPGGPAWPFTGKVPPTLTTGDISMRHLTAFLGFIILAASSAWAQTTPGSPPATGGPAATGQTGGLTDYWRAIPLALLATAADGRVS